MLHPIWDISNLQNAGLLASCQSGYWNEKKCKFRNLSSTRIRGLVLECSRTGLRGWAHEGLMLAMVWGHCDRNQDCCKACIASQNHSARSPLITFILVKQGMYPSRYINLSGESLGDKRWGRQVDNCFSLLRLPQPCQMREFSAFPLAITAISITDIHE